jgi:hypothetical protein
VADTYSLVVKQLGCLPSYPSSTVSYLGTQCATGSTQIRSAWAFITLPMERQVTPRSAVAPHWPCPEKVRKLPNVFPSVKNGRVSYEYATSTQNVLCSAVSLQGSCVRRSPSLAPRSLLVNKCQWSILPTNQVAGRSWRLSYCYMRLSVLMHASARWLAVAGSHHWRSRKRWWQFRRRSFSPQLKPRMGSARVAAKTEPRLCAPRN